MYWMQVGYISVILLSTYFVKMQYLLRDLGFTVVKYLL